MFENDWAMVLAKLSLCCALILCLPINLNPCRNAIIHAYQGQIEATRTQYSLIRHIFLSLWYMWASLLIAIFLPEIQIVFGFVGGVCSGIFVILIPSKNYAALLRAKILHGVIPEWKLMVWKFITACMLLIGVTGTVLLAGGVTE